MNCAAVWSTRCSSSSTRQTSSWPAPATVCGAAPTPAARGSPSAQTCRSRSRCLPGWPATGGASTACRQARTARSTWPARERGRGAAATPARAGSRCRLCRMRRPSWPSPYRPTAGACWPERTVPGCSAAMTPASPGRQPPTSPPPSWPACGSIRPWTALSTPARAPACTAAMMPAAPGSPWRPRSRHALTPCSPARLRAMPWR